MPPPGTAEQVEARDLAVMVVLSKPVDHRLAMFTLVCDAYRRSLEEQFPGGSRRIVRTNCRNFARAVLGRLQAIEMSNGATEGSA